MADAHKNFAVSAVATAPSPATSGTSLVVTAGHGTRFPAVPFNATVWPAGAAPDPSNAEIVRVTVVSTDTLTITRAQESTSARSITVGDQIAAGITAKTLTDAEGSGTDLYALPAVASGLWPIGAYGETLAVTVDRCYFVPFKISGSMSSNVMSIQVSSGAASSTARMFVVTDSGGFPDALVANSEVTGVATATAGLKGGTFSSAISLAAGSYYLCCVFYTAAPTVNAIRQVSPVVAPGVTYSQPGPVPNQATYVDAATSGTSVAAIISAWGGSVTTTAPRLALRRSA